MNNLQIKYDMKSDQPSSGLCEYQSSFTSPISDEVKNISKNEPDDESDFDYESLITEDDTPVDNLFSERQQQLLADSLYTNWTTSRIFMASANVGIYAIGSRIPIVPDMFLSMDVEPAEDIWAKQNRCYMVQVFGKPPELVVEVVSNTVGNERTIKFQQYEAMGVKYYIIFDPDRRIFKTRLHVYELKQDRYVAYHWQLIKKGVWFSDLDLGLNIQKRVYRKYDADFLVWYDNQGKILLPGEEKAKFEKNRADEEKNRADVAERKLQEEQSRADAALQELALLRAQLKNSPNSMR